MRTAAADPSNTQLCASWLSGQSKESRVARATMIARLASQRRMLILSEASGKKTHTVFAVVMGDEDGDAQFGAKLAGCWDGAVVPDLSRDVPWPTWVGRCRGCGCTVEATYDLRRELGEVARDEEDEAMLALGRMVARGLLVDRVPGPVSVVECRCGEVPR